MVADKIVASAFEEINITIKVYGDDDNYYILPSIINLDSTSTSILPNTVLNTSLGHATCLIYSFLPGSANLTATVNSTIINTLEFSFLQDQLRISFNTPVNFI